MNFFKTIAKSVLPGLLFLLFYTNVNGQSGQQIFQANCATCHSLDKPLTGPALRGVESRGPWTNRANLHKWVHSPAAFIPTTPYTQSLKNQYGQIMPDQPINDKEIDAVFDYIKTAPPPGTPGGDHGANTAAETSNDNSALLFGIISLVLALAAFILMMINSNLKKLSDDKEQILRPEPVPFYRNKVYIALIALLLFVIGGYYVSKGAIGLGRQQGYSPVQPIYYSHKVHAGINQINCLYCHGGAWESKHAGIPTLNICMNCHRAITSYEKGPKLYD
ncbi:MAG: c-type cytochrome, partial [Flavisolibacter sp.]